MTTTTAPTSEEILDHAMFMVDGMGSYFGKEIGMERETLRLLRRAVGDIIAEVIHNYGIANNKLAAWLADEVPSTFQMPA